MDRHVHQPHHLTPVPPRANDGLNMARGCLCGAVLGALFWAALLAVLFLTGVL